MWILSNDWLNQKNRQEIILIKFPLKIYLWKIYRYYFNELNNIKKKFKRMLIKKVFNEKGEILLDSIGERWIVLIILGSIHKKKSKL